MNASDSKQTFRQYCEMELSQAKFNALYQLEKFSNNKITKALNSPASMCFELLVIFAKELGETPIELAENFDCGMDAMSARQYRRISKEESHVPFP